MPSYAFSHFRVLYLPKAGPAGNLPPIASKLMYRGVVPYYVLGILALLAPLPLLIYMLQSESYDFMGQLLLFSSFALAVALFFLFRGNRLYRQRYIALSEGKIVEVVVVKQLRKWVFWQSKASYVLELSFIYEGKRERREVYYPKAVLHQFATETRFPALYHAPSDSFSAGLDLGILFQEQKEKQKK